MADLPAGYPKECAARFRPERKLAEGGFGEVWLATQVALDRPSAVKLLRADLAPGSDALARFTHEGRITASLEHPHIVRVLDHDVENGVPWIAFEFLPGSTLRDVLKSHDLSWPDAATAALQVARALQEAHGRGILHRDIKPENVLEAQPGIWKVADFGIAKWTEDAGVKTKTGVVLGTPAYLAPEQLKGEPAGPRSDLYSLGAMLFEALTGRAPFVEDSLYKIFERHVNAPRPKPGELRGGLPAALDELVPRLMAIDPRGRPGSAADAAAELERVLADPAAASAAPTKPRGQRATVKSGVVKRPAKEAGVPASTAGMTAPVGLASSPGTRRTARTAAVAAPAAAPAGTSRARIAAGVAIVLALAAGLGLHVTREPLRGPVLPVWPSGASVPPSPPAPERAPLTAAEQAKLESGHAIFLAVHDPFYKAIEPYRSVPETVELGGDGGEQGSDITGAFEEAMSGGLPYFELVKRKIAKDGAAPELYRKLKVAMDALAALDELVYRPGADWMRQLVCAWEACYYYESLLVLDREPEAGRWRDARIGAARDTWAAPFITAKCLESTTHLARGFSHKKLYERMRAVLPRWKAVLDRLGSEEELLRRPAGPELLLLYHILRREAYGETTHGDESGVQAESTARIDVATARLRAAPSANPTMASHLIAWSRKSVKATTRPGAPQSPSSARR